MLLALLAALYVGDAQCTSCHQQIGHTYHEVGMSKSFYRPRQDDVIEDFSKLPFKHAKSGDVMELRWRNDAVGQAGLGLPEGPTELVLALQEPYAPAWLVSSAAEAASTIEHAGGRVVEGPRAVPVGNLVVAADPFGNQLVLVDLSTGRYTTDADGTVTGVEP